MRTWAILARAHSPRLVHGGAVPGAQLLRPGGLLLGNPEAIANPFFLLAPKWACCPAAAGDARHRRSPPRRSSRGLLLTPAGGAARLSLPHPHRAHLRAGVRPDLYSGHQLAALSLCGDRHHELRALQQPGGGLWHRRDRHHGAHLHTLLLGGPPQLALAQAAGGHPLRPCCSPSTSRCLPPTSPRSSPAAGCRALTLGAVMFTLMTSWRASASSLFAA